MKRMIKITYVLIAFVLLLSVQVFAATEEVINDNFTNADVGTTLPSGWVTTKTGTGTGTAEVFADNGNRDLKITTITSSPGNTFGAKRSFSSANTETIINFKFKTDNDATNAGGIKYVYIYDSSNSKIAELRFSATSADDPAKTRVYAYLTSNTDVGMYTKDTWINVNLDINLATKKVTITIDNQTPVSISFQNTNAANVAAVEFSVQGANKAVWMDDLIVSKQLVLSDKSNLLTSINGARSLIQESVIGSGLEQYPQAASDQLNRAITVAQAVYDQTAPSQTDIDNNIIAIKTAVASFRGSVNLKFISSDNFDSLGNGSFPSDNWVNQSTNKGNVQVQQKTGSPGMSLSFTSTGDSNSVAAAAKSFEPLKGKFCVISYDAYTNQTAGIKPVIFYNSSNNEIARVSFADGKFRITGVGAYQDYSSFTANQWYHLQVVFDFDKDKFSVAVNGVELANTDLRVVSDDVAKVVCTTSSLSSSFEIDNLSISGRPQVTFVQNSIAVPGVSAEAVVNNKSGIILMVAMYHSDGTLLGAVLNSSTGNGNEIVSVIYPVTEVLPGDYMKLFLFDGTMVSYTDKLYQLN